MFFKCFFCFVFFEMRTIMLMPLGDLQRTRERLPHEPLSRPSDHRSVEEAAMHGAAAWVA